MDSTISRWYGDLLHDLLLYGTAERTFAIIGKVKFTSAGSIGDFVMEFPDGTKWYSTEQSKRAMELNQLFTSQFPRASSR